MIFLSYFIYHLFFINIFMWFTWGHSLLFKRKLCLWSINSSHIHRSRNRIIGGKKQRIVEIGKKKKILKEMERSKNMSTDLPPHLFELYCFKPVRKKKPNQPLKQLMRLAKSGFPVSEMCQRLSLSLLHNTFLSLFFFFCKSAEAFPRNKLGQTVLSLLEKQLGQWDEEQVEISERGRWPGKSWILANPLD